MSTNVAIIDGDLLAYNAGFAANRMLYTIEMPGGKEEFRYKKDAVRFCEEVGLVPDIVIIKERVSEPFSHSRHNMELLLNNIREDVSEEFLIVLSGTGNFRNDVAMTKEYKANRNESHKPEHLDKLKTYLSDTYNTIVSENCEADDWAYPLAADVADAGYVPVYCTLDKDWRQMAGHHYNWRKRELDNVSEVDAVTNFWTQVLTGDRTDNIPGLEGIGPAKAARILGETNTTDFKEAWTQQRDKVLLAYQDKGHSREYLLEQCKLIYLWRKIPDEFDLEVPFKV